MQVTLIFNIVLLYMNALLPPALQHLNSFQEELFSYPWKSFPENMFFEFWKQSEVTEGEVLWIRWGSTNWNPALAFALAAIAVQWMWLSALS